MLKLVIVLSIAASIAAKKSSNVTPERWVCYDGQVPRSWSEKKKLEEFAKGPCSPVLVAPGIGGSKMEIIIDCKALQEGDPATFKRCGWNRCPSSDSAETMEDQKLGYSPSSEYRIWVPYPFSPMTVLSPSEANKDCFAGLIGVDYDTSSGKVVYKPRPGVRVKPMGATPGTMQYIHSKCGSDGIENLIPEIPNPEGTGYMRDIVERLEYMGYEHGLTMQSMPYDWRLGNGMDDLSRNYARIVMDMYNMVNKKVVILAHSMGNFRTSDFLWKSSQDFKDKYILNYLAMAPPYLGASEAILFLTCGSTEYTLPFHLGVDYTTYVNSIGTFASVWQLAPYETYYTQKDTEWMAVLKKRIAYENGLSEDPVFSFLPMREEVCYPKYPSSKYCKSGLFVYSSFGLTKEKEIIDASNFKEVMEKISPNPRISQVWGSRQEEYNTLPNFGVPLILAYSRVADTAVGYNFKIDPKEFVAEHKTFCDSQKNVYEILNKGGDGTVPSTSAVTAGYKFAYEFEKKQPGAKPVVFVDICSEKNAKGTPYNIVNGKKVIDKNAYVGLPCDCTEQKERHCTHNGMLFLDTMMDFISETLNTGIRGSLSAKTQAKAESYFTDWVKNCRLWSNNIMSPAEKKFKEE